jgi:uncharacterized repeat protein (TIGR01451 family)
MSHLMTSERAHRHLPFRAVALAATLLTALVLSPRDARAFGTAAGTVVTNTVTVNATVGGAPVALSATTSFTVAERIDLTLTWQDAASVPVAVGQTNAVTAYLLTNIGNGNDSYTLSATGTGIGGDQFDPTVTALYLDTNGNDTFDLGTDTLYSTGTGTIAADGSRTVFVLSTIPSTTLNTGDLGIVQLVATSVTGAGPAGTIVAGAGENGTDAVIGTSQGTQTAAGSYVITSLTTVNVVKTATVSDPFGGSRPQPGATIHYTLTVTVSGVGTANSVVITDAVPANTNYTGGTLTLDGITLGDTNSDGDAGDVGFTTPGTVTVSLGTMTSASPARVITFDVTID